ncbi:MAG: RNase adapter RapZ [Oscillospiraceae bacterium]|nr:RNase adapter RapZ [Oscillospiraceae bacterium]
MQFVIVSGMSGAGKSKAVSILEDFGYYCVDNMPAQMLPPFAKLCLADGGKYEHVALVTDVRGGDDFSALFTSLDELEKMNCKYNILFMEAAPETIVRRYKETRRKHPLSNPNTTLREAIQKERMALTPVRARATYIIDTTALSNAKLRDELRMMFARDDREAQMSVSVISFGYKYGIPIEADLVLDVRFLPNPFYIDDLRSLSGLDAKVYDFIFSYQQTRDFMKYLERLIAFLLPLYSEEGKTSLVIAVGCTGGQHRSVAITRALADFIKRKGYQASENHRDMTRA